ncbi:MAG TPA: hypothetical protein VGS02_10830 [Acidobacteriaceae bacterium]|nr:hypothetical protein [Acidobacteriaceae bacterium]
MKQLFVAAAVAFAVPVLAQSHPAPQAHLAATVMPAAQEPGAQQPVFLQKDVKARIEPLIAEAKAKGSSGATLADYGSYKLQLSVRSVSGGAEIHAHWDDVMMVEQGSATLITGGTVPDAKTNADGETHGSKIVGGQEQTLNPGDMVTVHAGTPHQLLIPVGTIYSSVVVKIHEP